MAVGEIVNVLRVMRRRAGASQIRMAFGAGFFAGGGNIYAAAMFRVAGGAVGSADLSNVVDRAVVAREASLILHFRREYRGLPQVTRGALVLKHRVGCGHAAAAIYARIFVERVPRNPQYCQGRKKHT